VISHGSGIVPALVIRATNGCESWSGVSDALYRAAQQAGVAGVIAGIGHMGAIWPIKLIKIPQTFSLYHTLQKVFCNGFMIPQEKKTTTESIALFKQTLEGNNYSPQSIKAYMGDLGQFVEWLKTRRVDWDIPYRIARIDIVEFINHLATRKATAATRQRKLAAIRGFLKFLKDNQIIFGNPADTIEGAIREERDPAILLKTEYKALLQVAGGNSRDFAIVMVFLQSGLRVSELVNLKIQDIDFTTREITIRQGKGRKDRVVPIVKQAREALKAYLKVDPRAHLRRNLRFGDNT
jgi:site-specific recombinase XerD